MAVSIGLIGIGVPIAQADDDPIDMPVPPNVHVIDPQRVPPPVKPLKVKVHLKTFNKR